MPRKNNQTPKPDNTYGMCMEFEFLKSEVEKPFFTYLTLHLLNYRIYNKLRFW